MVQLNPVNGTQSVVVRGDQNPSISRLSAGSQRAWGPRVLLRVALVVPLLFPVLACTAGPAGRARAGMPVAPHQASRAAEATPTERTYFLGVAKIGISPQHPVLLSGYAGRTHELTQNVVQPLWARAMVIGAVPEQETTTRDDGTAREGTNRDAPNVLLTVDNCAVHAAVRRVVAAELESRYGIDPTRLTITSSHTHSGPMLSGALGNLLIRDQTAEEAHACERYTQQLIQQLVEVTGQALAARQRVTLERVTGELDFAINRRGGGVVDHQLPLLVARDGEQQPVLLLTNYACHCVAAGSGLEICGDWAGFASESLEAKYPSAVAMVMIGCGADQNPAMMGGVAAAQTQGQQLAKRVEDLLQQPARPIQGALETKFAELTLPLDTLPTEAQWRERAQQPGIIGYHAHKQLRRLAAGEALPTEVPYPIQSWAFGSDLALVFLGGEVVVDYVHLLRQRLDPERLWVTAYANDVPCYIPSRRILREGGYEGGDAMVWYDLPTRLTEDCERLILDEVQSQLGPNYAASHDPSRTGGTWPKSPEAALASLITHPELRVELVASEPLVQDPVAIDFGPDGRLWVAQMHDYPEGLDGAYQAGGSIRVLSDTTGDGQYDHATTFLDGLPFPTDVKVWRDGVLIATAPNVLFARDTTGDGRADEVTPLLSGFETHNYQARVNSLTWGLDHWVHGAAGIFGGQVRDEQGRETDLRNRDFRFRPDSGEVEAVSGRTQQGRARDEWGNWFGCDNGSLLFHYPATEHYARRQPLAPAPPAVVSVPRSQQLYPPDQIVQWALSGPPGVPTAACGLGFLRSDLLGTEYYNHAFTCEPVNQLVHRQILVPQGVTFQGQRAENEQQREFLWSTDRWFRPVQAKTGLDGALYVVDMYRFLIEHPRFLSDDVRATLDVRAGQDRGRIYRVVPRDRPVPPPAEASDLSRRSWEDLAAELDTANGTRRDLIHQLLWWQVEPSQLETAAGQRLVAVLEQRGLRSERPAVRVQVLALLGQWGRLNPDALLAALNDEHAAVRRMAVQMTEPSGGLGELVAGTSGGAGAEGAVPGEGAALAERLAERCRALVDDPSAAVRLQLAYSAGQWHAALATPILDRLLARDAADPWITAAVYSSLTPASARGMVAARIGGLAPDAALPESVRQLVRMAWGRGEADVINDLVSLVPWPAAELDATSDTGQKSQQSPALKDPMPSTGIPNTGTPNTGIPRKLVTSAAAVWELEWWCLVGELLAQPGESDQGADAVATARLALAVRRTLSELSEAVDTVAAVDVRRPLQVELLGWSDDAEGVRAGLQQALRPQSPVPLQRAALQAWARLVRRAEPTWADAYCEMLPTLTPELQQQALRLTQASPRLAQALLAGMETGRVPRNLLDATARQLLMDHPDLSVQSEARKQFAGRVEGTWRERFPQFVGLDVSLGDPERGRALFRQHCAACHRMEDFGQAVGPDLRALSDLSVSGLLASILDPSVEMDARYAAYVALTTSGEVVSGLLESETDQAVTLLGQGGQRATVRRNEIEAWRRTGKSLMPEGLEQEFTPASMQDLLRYLGAVAWQGRYEYPGPGGPHPNYPDSQPPTKLVNRHFGTDRFDDGQWVSFYHVGQRQHRVMFDLGAEQTLSRLRITYGVNHRPGAIHAPQAMTIRLESDSGVEPVEVVVTDWDNSPDGLGVYQIARRQRAIEFPPTAARRVQLQWESDQEWTLFSEIEFNPVGDGAPTSPVQAGEAAMTGTEQPAKQVERMRALLASVAVGTADEYRVIPSVWQLTIEAGRRNQDAELLALLEAALPVEDQPLADWQAVVLGGGLINGISQAGPYPGMRLEGLVRDRPELRARLERSLRLAAEMVERSEVPQGTRYDALRMIALRGWEDAGPQLRRYLQPGTPHELQMGAVSGLADVPLAEAAEWLHAALDDLPADLRELAVAGLVRDQAGSALRKAVQAGRLKVSDLHPEIRGRWTPPDSDRR